ncbi:MAG: polysaccharide biosynthesis tyrosine autokinase [Colwellia sp.]
MSLTLINANNTNSTNKTIEEKESVDLHYHFRVIKRYKWKIFSLAFIVTLLAAIITFSITPQYTATATLLIQEEKANVVSIEEVYGLDSSKEYLFTQFEILKSRELSRRVVNKLEINAHPEFALASSKESFSITAAIKSYLPFLPQKRTVQTKDAIENAKQRAVVSAFKERLSVSPILKTQLVNLSFESTDPLLAANAVNTLADVYIENHLEAKLMMTEKASLWMNGRLITLKDKLDSSISTLLAYQNKEQLIDIDGVKSIEAKELQLLNHQLSSAKQRLEQSQHIYNLVVEKRSDYSQLIALPEILNHKLIQNVNNAVQLAKTKISELKGVYGPKHPIMIAAQSELNSVNENLNNQIKLLISSISNEFKSAKVNEQSLMTAVRLKGQGFRELSALDTKQRELKREVDSNQQLYNAFFTRLKETKEVGEFQSANARVIDVAMPPLVPSKPRKKLIIALALILSIIIGIGLAFLLEALNDGIRSVDDVENTLKQRMLGLLPRQKLPRKQRLPLRIFYDKNEHAFSESIRTLRTSLLLMNIENGAKVFSVTSSIPGEGKTTVSINLSFALAQLEKVLLIDADMRRPSIAKSFSIASYQPGLSNIISGSHSFSESVVHDEESGIDLITAGTLPPNPQELLASASFVSLIESLRGKYDRIVIDTAPTQAVSDAVLVSQQSDSLIYIVKADSTRQKMITSGLNRLLRVGVRIDGIVLNQVDLKQAAKYGEYTGYYDQYGYNADMPIKKEEKVPEQS